MSSHEGGGGEPGRGPALRVAQVLGIVLVALGVALLLLPYDAAFHIDVPPGGIFVVADLPDEVPCQAPLVDLLRKDPDVWINYAPDTGTTVGHEDDRLGGSACIPESTVRGTGGVALVALGAAITILASVVARRRRADAKASGARGPDAEGPASGRGTDEPPDDEAGAGGVSSAPG
jgi:hypothetical protein